MTTFVDRSTVIDAAWLNAVDQAVIDTLTAPVNVFSYMTDAQVADVVAGTLLLDCTAAIQAAVDWAIYRNNASQKSLGKVYLPQGLYKTTDTIHLGYGTSTTSVIFEGAGRRYASSGNFCGTGIVPTFSDRPVISIQGARGTTVRALSMQGKNRAYVLANHLGDSAGASINDLVAANWVDTTFAAAASSQYAPYCGIAIDPYTGVRPATSYPDVTYPSWLGVVAQYGKAAHSSEVKIEDVEIDGFVVGVANKPCNGDGNADYTKLLQSAIYNCQYGLSVCNTQSRLVHVEDCTIIRVHTGIVTTKHGIQNGKPQILVTSTEIGKCTYWVDAPNAAYGSIKFDSCYGEVVYAIGIVGGAGARAAPVTFANCEWNLTGRNTRGQPVYTLNNTGTGIVTFENCNISGDGTTLHLNFGGTAEQYSFRGFNNILPEDAANLYEKYALNSTLGITFTRLTTELIEFSAQNTGTWDLDTGSSNGALKYGFRNLGARPVLLPVYSQMAKSDSVGDPGVMMPAKNRQTIGKAGIVGSLTVSGRDVTFASGLSEETIINAGGANGDIIWDDATGVIYYVKSRTGSTLTMTAQTGYDGAGELLTAPAKTGSYYVMNCRTYTPSVFMEGDTTASSAVITNVGTRLTATYTGAEVAVNDYVAVWRLVDAWMATAAAANKITAKDGAAGTITVNANIAATEANRRLYAFYRAEPANA